MANRRPTIKLLDNDDDKNVLDPEFKKTSDDTIFITGTLSSSIPISFSLRGGSPFKGQPGLDWRIAGSEGEIKVTAAGPFVQVGYPDTKIEVHDFASDKVEEVRFEEDLADLPQAARNVGRVYKAFAEGKNNCSFEDAVEKHRLIAQMYKENGIED